MVRRIGWLCLPALLLAGPAMAGSSLWRLENAIEPCIQTAGKVACSQAEAAVISLTKDPAYNRASHLCREEIGELSTVVKLLPKRDVIPTEVMASVADVQQACIPYGF